MSDQLTVDPQWFRQVLGHFPTGVCAVTAIEADGTPTGMSVGSFTSVSLEPPLVAFLPAKSSTSWPRIRDTGRFCVNVLGADQEPVCRSFAARGADKFAGLGWRPSPSGQPIIEGSIAWIDCTLEAVHEAGDHFIVVGRVDDLDVANGSLPLLFFQGGYGRFMPESLASGDRSLIDHLRRVDIARNEMELLATEVGVECVASALVIDEIVIVASAGGPRDGAMRTHVGLRYPFMAPVGAVFVAWAEPAVFDTWLRRTCPLATADDAARHRAIIADVADRGYAAIIGDQLGPRLEAALAHSRRVSESEFARVLGDVGVMVNPATLADEDEVALSGLSAPVYGPDGSVVLGLNLNGFGRTVQPGEIDRHAERLTETADRISKMLSEASLSPPA